MRCLGFYHNHLRLGLISHEPWIPKIPSYHRFCIWMAIESGDWSRFGFGSCRIPLPQWGPFGAKQHRQRFWWTVHLTETSSNYHCFRRSKTKLLCKMRLLQIVFCGRWSWRREIQEWVPEWLRIDWITTQNLEDNVPYNIREWLPRSLWY